MSGVGSAMGDGKLDRIRGALWGALIADAVAMPAHWYYGGPRQIVADYGGPIQGYVKPKMQLMVRRWTLPACCVEHAHQMYVRHRRGI
jgi:ADP-ribosylglycohydrolase